MKLTLTTGSRESDHLIRDRFDLHLPDTPFYVL